MALQRKPKAAEAEEASGSAAVKSVRAAGYGHGGVPSLGPFQLIPIDAATCRSDLKLKCERLAAEAGGTYHVSCSTSTIASLVLL